MLSSRWRLNIVRSRSQETNVNVQRHVHIHTPTQRNITYAEPTACVTMLYLISPPGTVWLSCCRPALPWWGWGRGRLGPPWCSRFLRMSWRHREQTVHSSYIDRLRYRGWLVQNSTMRGEFSESCSFNHCRKMFSAVFQCTDLHVAIKKKY